MSRREDLARLALPGDGYYKTLKRLHKLLKPATYVEIGVRKGKSLSLAAPPTISIGIDPEPSIQYEFSAQTAVYKMTSNEFFVTCNLPEIIRAEHFSLAFIDGLHLFEQCLLDFINLERFAKPSSIILIHDCIPLDAISSARERTTGFYSGDVWKILPIIKRYRPEVDFFTIKTPPTGLGVFTNLNPASRILGDRYQDVVGECVDLKYDFFVANKESFLQSVGNDWETIERRFRSCAALTT
jgi:hypothetical protein